MFGVAVGVARAILRAAPLARDHGADDWRRLVRRRAGASGGSGKASDQGVFHFFVSQEAYAAAAKAMISAAAAILSPTPTASMRLSVNMPDE